MAASDARNPISVTTPFQISKDMYAADSTIPLSPQWLLPKPGDNKAGFTQGENQVIPPTDCGDLTDVIKSPVNDEEKHESHKKKDVFRPTFLDSDSGRRDRWRDEERDTNSSFRRDRWREVDKEIGDNHKTDRWVDNSSIRHLGEARRAPAERRADPSKDANYDQRRESKWNTRWGPDNKEVDKSTEHGKHVDMPYDKGLSHGANHGKDEREGVNYRPWRPSSMHSRGKSEPQHHQTQTASKEGSIFSHGRGRGENTPTYSVGRGRSNIFGVTNNSGHSQPMGLISDRGDNGHEEMSSFRYSRTKLLDVYRLTDVKSSNKILDGLLQAPSLTHDEPMDPLALCAPMPEESAILKGIDKGDIVSSGALPVSKEGSAGRSSIDFPPSRRTKLGVRDDVSTNDAAAKTDNSKGAYSNILEGMPHEKLMGESLSNLTTETRGNHDSYSANKFSVEGTRENVSRLNKFDDVSNDRDSSIKGSVPGQSGIPWRSISRGEHMHPPQRDWFDVPNDARARNSDVPSDVCTRSSDISWPHGLRDASSERENGPDPSRAQNPEDLVLLYKDPQGHVQGPFSGSDIIGWFEAGYFGIDLLVREAHAPNDSPFSLLGDVMLHLRAKAKPPPGFNTAKQSEVTEASGRPILGGMGKVIPGPSAIDSTGIDRLHTHGASTDAENRFLESLMSGDLSGYPLARFASSEALQGLMGLTSSGMPPPGSENADALSLLAKRMNLELQKSSPHPYPPYWPPRDTAPAVQTLDIQREPSVLQPNLHASIADVARQSHPQNVEMMSIRQGLLERTSTGMNNGVGSWPNFPVQGGLEPFNDKTDMHHGQNLAQAMYGMQHTLQPQNHSPVSNLFGQTLESPNLVAERLLSYGLAQDPQVLNLLQQQYLLQMQSQQPMAVPQLSLIDKILLLNQQQKQEEQQQLLRQQQLFSKILSEQHLSQRFADPSYAQLQTSVIPVGNAQTEHSMPQLSHQLFQASQQVPASSMMQDDRIANSSNIPPKVSQGLTGVVASASTSLHLPHQIFEAQKSWPSIPSHNEHNKLDSSSLSVKMENSAMSEALEKSQVASGVDNSTPGFNAPSSLGEALQNYSDVSGSLVGGKESSVNSVPPELPECMHKSRVHEDKIVMTKGTNDVKVTSSDIHEETPVKVGNAEVSTTKAAKISEACEVKKSSEKKSRKTKSSKVQLSSDLAKGASKTPSSQQPKPSEMAMSKEKSRDVSHIQEVDLVSSNVLDGDFESESKVEQKPSDCVTQQDSQVNASQRAWKPAIGVKPKSLLEIQQEEQRAQTEAPVSVISSPISYVSHSSPWGGVVPQSEAKVLREVYHDSGNSMPKMAESELTMNRRSGLRDLLAQEVLAKSNEREIEISYVTSNLPPLPNVTPGFNAPSSLGEALQNYSDVSGSLVGGKESSVNSVPPELPECMHKSRVHEDKIVMTKGTNDVKVTSDIHEETPVKVGNAEVSTTKAAKISEACEVKKSSEKKSRKTKSSKVQLSSDLAKGASKTPSSQQPKPSEMAMSKEKSRDVSHIQEVDLVSSNVLDGDFESESKVEQKPSDCVTQQDSQVNASQRAWKPAIGVKPKSLLEIQQEEQRAQTEAPVSVISSPISYVSHSSPWGGVVPQSEAKVLREVYHDSGNSMPKMAESELTMNRRSGLRDLLAQEVLAKSNEREIEISYVTSNLPPLPNVPTQVDIADDDNFIEAKDTKKSRKKAAKAKGAGAKVSTPIPSTDATVASSPTEKVKISKHVQAEKEVLPAPPAGPSLGDFVLWKGEPTSPSPPPAWSTDPVKPSKPLSLRDILTEQEKKVPSSQQNSQTLIPLKHQPAQTRASLRSASGSSPSKDVSPIQVYSQALSQSKSKGEEDLFWGPSEQSNQEKKQPDFPQHGGRTTKSSPGKGPLVASNKQKLAGGKSTDHSFSSSPHSIQASVKGKRDGSTKHSEAMDFRDWCESESVRLIGSKDTSFLEFCLKQSRSEAEILLTENLGSFDPNHEFIEKFLNYMELLSPDVIEIAFQSRYDLKASSYSRAREVISENLGSVDYEGYNGPPNDGSAKGGGVSKKKGKKGKKVSASVLGFNVVSNRIMMGEIQSVEDY